VRRLSRSLPLVLVALLLVALPAAASAGVRLQGIDTSHYPAVRATVVSSAGPAFRPALTEDGKTVTGLEAANLANSVSVVLAIDRSRSMQKKFSDAIGAARNFVAGKPGTDSVAVLAFGSSVVSESRFSQDGSDADAALQNLVVDRKNGTALYDAVGVAVRELTPRAGAHVLILLTDGADTTSKQTLEVASAAAREHNVLVYAIGIAGRGYTPEPLQQLAHDSGGAFYQASSSSALSNVYAAIANRLRNTWRIQYVTAARPGDEIHLQAAVAGAGTGSASTQIPTAFGVPNTPPPSKLVPSGAYGPSGPLAVGLAVGALVFLAFVLILAAYRGSWVKTRIAAHIGETRATPKQKRREQTRAVLGSLFRATEQAFGHLRQWRAIQRMLERADVPLRTVELLWIMIGAGFGLALIAAILGQSAPVILGVLLIGAAVPFFVVWRKMRNRLAAFEEQLPDLLITIAASLKAGHSFKQGLQAVVDEGQPPASDELKRVLTETSLGRPMDEALADMADRAGSANFEFAITAVTIQRQVGGSLATLFDMVADTVRQRHQFARKIRSLTAMGRMSAYVLVGVPIFLGVVITLISPAYMSPLWHTRTGHYLVALGLVMITVGYTILKRIVSFRG
jgi:tight adherence protein B